MIAEFSVENFYSIRTKRKISFISSGDPLMEDEYCHRVDDTVSLLKIGIIYGANASGKSTVLSALIFFRDLMLNMPKDKSEELDYYRFLFDNHSKNEHTSMSMSFYLESEKFILSVEFDNQRIYKESLFVYSTNRPTQLYKRKYNQDTDSTGVTFGGTLKLPKSNQQTIIGNTINNSTVLAAFGKSNVEASKLNLVYDFFASSMPEVLSPQYTLSGYTRSKLNKDTDGKLKQFLLKFLKASDFNISDLSLHEEEHVITPEISKVISNSPMPQEAKDKLLKDGKFHSEEIAFRHKTDEGTYDMDEALESSGTIRFMGIATILYELLTRNRFVTIDEVETSIHYELLSYFIKCFLANSEKESQLLLTTHDINLLNENFIRRDTIWFTDKDSCGETHIERLSALGLHKNLSPYNAYKQGKLVKLPFLDSPYLDLGTGNEDEK